MTVTSPGPGDPLLGMGQIPSQSHDMALMFAKFAEMPDRGLAQTEAKITADIKMHLQSLGSRIAAIEDNMDATMVHTNQNTDRIQDLHNQLDGHHG